jgi:peptidoglycan LD-endopeptidase LytH
VYYYAHLDAYRPGLAEGQTIARGDVLGTVGTTGNAPKDTPHLHFQVMRMPADGKYWDGEAINPYPLFLLLHAARP